jgi:hypothetical protein
MSERAICRYNCPNCQTELEQEGYVYVDAQDEELAAKMLRLDINQETCPNCRAINGLPLPLLYHDGDHKLLISYLPGVEQLSQEDIAEAIKLPYELVVTDVAKRMGIQFPEPDPAAFPRGEEHLYTPFSGLTQEQAAEILPEYLLRPTVVGGLEIMSAMIQAVNEGMETSAVLEDMARLQLINALIETRPDPIARRKVLHHNQPYINEDFFEVVDTLRQQMVEENNNDMVEKLDFVRAEVERYKASQQARLQKEKPKAE